MVHMWYVYIMLVSVGMCGELGKHGFSHLRYSYLTSYESASLLLYCIVLCIAPLSLGMKGTIYNGSVAATLHGVWEQ